MKLLGKWNWYLPHWLEWLPKLSVEGAPAPAGPPQGGPEGPGRGGRPGWGAPETPVAASTPRSPGAAPPGFTPGVQTAFARADHPEDETGAGEIPAESDEHAA